MPEFIDSYGVAIVYDVSPAVGEQRAIVQLAHGLGEHVGRYTALITALTEAGYTVYADDHRGHGRTGMRQWNDDATKLGKLGKGGHRAAVDAVGEFTQLIRSENPGVPLVLLGHSWGSMIAQKLVAQHSDHYDAVVLSGSALLTPTDLNPMPLNKQWAGDGANGNEWLSTDPAVQIGFHEDPLTTEEPMLKLFGFFEAAKVYGRPPKNLARDVPMLLMVGADDPVGGPKSVHKLAAEYRTRSGLTDVTVFVYPGDRHEIFNEPNQAEVRADLLGWLDAHIARA